MNLSSRLQTINDMVERSYDHIWDCCCDHGFLGLQLLRRHAGNTIHFVDIVEHIMTALEAELSVLKIEQLWKVHCLDVNNLPLLSEEKISSDFPIVASSATNNNDDHLIIIAGVGGERLIELMESILTKHPEKRLEFILCPVHHNFKVREYLAGRAIGLVKEVLVRENRRFYEVLHVTTNGSDDVSLVGREMWNLGDAEHLAYLKRTIEHYKFKLSDSSIDAKRIIELYEGLLLI